MKVQMDINSYRAAFTGFAKQYNFYVNMVFPGWSNVLRSGAQGLLAGGMGNIFGIDNLSNALLGTASTAIGTLTTNGGVEGLQFMVRASYLPDSTFEEVVSSWMGHDYKMAGKQTFADWTVTFNVDKNGVLLRKFNDWQKLMHDPLTNTYGNPITYMTDPEVHLLGFDSGETVCVYKMYGAWPKMIGQVVLDSSVGDVATVDITFAYQYHTVTETEPGSLAGIAKQGVRSFFQMGGMDLLMGEAVSSSVDAMTPDTDNVYSDETKKLSLNPFNQTKTEYNIFNPDTGKVSTDPIKRPLVLDIPDLNADNRYMIDSNQKSTDSAGSFFTGINDRPLGYNYQMGDASGATFTPISSTTPIKTVSGLHGYTNPSKVNDTNINVPVYNNTDTPKQFTLSDTGSTGKKIDDFLQSLRGKTIFPWLK